MKKSLLFLTMLLVLAVLFTGSILVACGDDDDDDDDDDVTDGDDDDVADDDDDDCPDWALQDDLDSCSTDDAYLAGVFDTQAECEAACDNCSANWWSTQSQICKGECVCCCGGWK